MAYKIDYEKARLNGTLGIIILIVLVLCCIGLSFMLLHNPHKDLQKSVFSTAKRIQTYYRDRPGYWKLSTETAKNDNLLRICSNIKNMMFKSVKEQMEMLVYPVI